MQVNKSEISTSSCNSNEFSPWLSEGFLFSCRELKTWAGASCRQPWSCRLDPDTQQPGFLLQGLSTSWSLSAAYGWLTIKESICMVLCWRYFVASLLSSTLKLQGKRCSMGRLFEGPPMDTAGLEILCFLQQCRNGHRLIILNLPVIFMLTESPSLCWGTLKQGHRKHKSRFKPRLFISSLSYTGFSGSAGAWD